MHPSQYGMYFVVIILSVLFGWFVLEHIGGWFTLILIAVGLWYWTLRRGMLAVKAWLYLDLLSQGKSPQEANMTASVTDAEGAAVFAPAAKRLVQQQYGGKQLAMIADARSRGFVG